jgi:hypothetical protein
MLQYFETLTDDSGNSLLGAIATVTNYPSGTLASIFNTNGTASPVANSTVVADITGQISFYAPDGAYTIVYSYKGTPYKTKTPVQLLDPMGLVTATDTGGAANTYVVTNSAYPASLYTGLKATFTAAHTNSGASTFNLNATGAQPIVQAGGAALTAGAITTGGIYNLQWTGAAWQLINSVITAAIIGGALYPVLAVELATVTATQYPYGDVRRYGAVGGGVTDDSVAFQSAGTVSGLFPMIIPFIAGGYLVNTPVVLPANAQVFGNNYPLLFSTVAGSHIMSSTGNAGLTVRGVNFQGLNSTTVPLAGFGGFAAANTGLLTAANCTDVRITDCGFSTFYNCVTTQGCTRVWTTKNRLQHWLFIGALGAQSSYIFVDENIFDTCDQNGAVVAYACNITGDQNGGHTSQFVSFCNNIVRNVPSWDAFGSHDVDGLRVIGNDCRNVRHGIDVGHLVSTNFVQNVVISDNYIEGPAVDTWGGAAAEIGAIICEGFDATHRVAGCKISDNEIKNFFNVAGMVGGGQGAACIIAAYADDASISDNIITNCATLSGGAVIPQSTGIYLTGTCNRPSVTGNSLQGNTFNRGGIRTNALTFDILTIVGNEGIYTTASTPHVNHINGVGGILNVNSNPTNSTVPYLESGSSSTNTSNYTLAGSGNAATAVSNNSTIPTAFGFVQCTVAAGSTGNILAPGIAPGQEIVILNESGANTITMAAAGTSNVADGVGCVIAVNSYKRFVWSAATSLWYHS